MQKENIYHKLFRARLPVVTLPQDFADRLTKSVLDEVTRLYQANLLPLDWESEQVEDSNPLNAPSSSEGSSALTQTTITLFLLLLINLSVGLLLPGCMFNQPAALGHTSFSQEEAGASATGKVDLPVQQTLALARGEPVQHKDKLWVGTSHLPPLDLLKPELPVAALMEAVHLTRRGHLQKKILPTLDYGPTNLYEPSATAQHSQVITSIATMAPPVMTTGTALIMPNEALNTAQQIAEATTVEPVPTSKESTPPTLAVTPTIKAPSEKPTLTTVPNSLQTPVFSIFEPTMTATPSMNEPTTTAIAEKTATPTVYIHPLRTVVPEPVTTAEVATPISTPEA